LLHCASPARARANCPSPHAATTTVGLWPCNEARVPTGSVIILSAEDSAADTIIPRLVAAGADRNRVQIVDAVWSEDGKSRKCFNLQADLAPLEQKIADRGDVSMVIVDPVSSYLGKADSHKNAPRVLEPLSEMASRTHVAGVFRHALQQAVGSRDGQASLHRLDRIYRSASDCICLG
jgi:putative DNA primase/helicase